MKKKMDIKDNKKESIIVYIMKCKNKNTLINNSTTKINKNHNKNDDDTKVVAKCSNKAVTRIKDWSDYNAGMVDRGHFRKLAELAVSEMRKEMSSRAWKQHKTAGRPKTYPDALILIIAVYREIFGMTLREAAGFAKDVFEEFNIEEMDLIRMEILECLFSKIDMDMDNEKLDSISTLDRKSTRLNSSH